MGDALETRTKGERFLVKLFRTLPNFDKSETAREIKTATRIFIIIPIFIL